MAAGPPSFDDSFRRLLTSPQIDDDWFASLRALYQIACAEQRERIRAAIGWTDDTCREPPDEHLFAADFTDRSRAWLFSEETFITRLLSTCESVRDYRDLLIHLAGLYHLLILRGFDPDAVLARVAERCAPRVGDVLRAFLRRSDKDLTTWPYEGARLDDGRVTLRRR